MNDNVCFTTKQVGHTKKCRVLAVAIKIKSISTHKPDAGVSEPTTVEDRFNLWDPPVSIHGHGGHA